MLSRKLVVSFHDLHPGSMECCIRFLNRLERIGVPRASLLVVPNWYGRTPLDEYPDVCAWLRGLPHDISLHGWAHTALHKQGRWLDGWVASRYTDGEGEFFRLPAPEAEWLLSKGAEMFRRAEIQANGFIAPAWLMEEALLPLLRKVGLGYSVTLGKVFDLRNDRILRAPVLCTTSRTPLRRSLTRPVVAGLAKRHVHEPILRIAVHPADFQYPAIEAFIYRTIAEALETRESVTYAELVVG